MASCARQATRCALHRRHALSGHHTRNRCRAAGRPSIGDTRSVTRGEVLALKLAEKAGIPAAPARIVLLGETPIAVIRRFDRGADDTRIPYQSAATLLQTSREEDRSYTELVDAMHTHAKNPTADIQQLWRRILFNLLITNVDDHLQNHGFLHVDNGHWRLAPAFDINPFPDRERESKTWLSEEDDPITDIHMLMARAAWFSLNEQQARQILGEVHQAVRQWKRLRSVPKSASGLLSWVIFLQHSSTSRWKPPPHCWADPTAAVPPAAYPAGPRPTSPARGGPIPSGPDRR